ncbi:MAG: 50S ribosomal protein L11 methyltransferase [Verrucomicrobiota bacterium]|nr:50S ribosomal protein L11 methyltransferase [Verrucomicrobiota bacterium]
MKYIWRKNAGAKWLRKPGESLASRFGALLAVIERPGATRATIQVSCKTQGEARDLVREFGGSIGRLRPDWLQEFAKQTRTKPLRIGSRLVILRTFEKAAASSSASGARQIIIPAEAAFGTGEHATTAMCLRLLERITRGLTPGWSMLDAGTGSGILAIAASCLGAGSVLAVENDPLACATAKRNAHANGVRKIEFSTSNVLTLRLTGKFDFITANLFSEILIEALPVWSRHLVRDGRLILSGILRSQESTVVRALQREGFIALELRRRGKWISVSACSQRK